MAHRGRADRAFCLGGISIRLRKKCTAGFGQTWIFGSPRPPTLYRANNSHTEIAALRSRTPQFYSMSKDATYFSSCFRCNIIGKASSAKDSYSFLLLNWDKMIFVSQRYGIPFVYSSQLERVN